MIALILGRMGHAISEMATIHGELGALWLGLLLVAGARPVVGNANHPVLFMHSCGGALGYMCYASVKMATHMWPLARLNLCCLEL